MLNTPEREFLVWTERSAFVLTLIAKQGRGLGKQFLENCGKWFMGDWYEKIIFDEKIVLVRVTSKSQAIFEENTSGLPQLSGLHHQDDSQDKQKICSFLMRSQYRIENKLSPSGRRFLAPPIEV